MAAFGSVGANHVCVWLLPVAELQLQLQLHSAWPSHMDFQFHLLERTGVLSLESRQAANGSISRRLRRSATRQAPCLMSRCESSRPPMQRGFMSGHDELVQEDSQLGGIAPRGCTCQEKDKSESEWARTDATKDWE